VPRPERASLHVGLCVLHLHLPGLGSLKAKRQVLRSLKDRLRSRFNVAVAEIDHQDLWQRSTLGVVSVASAHVPLEQTLMWVREEVERRLPGEVLDCDMEYLTS
jgi:uncharacterized protein